MVTLNQHLKKARASRRKRGPDYYATIGKMGAEKRWGKKSAQSAAKRATTLQATNPS